MQWKGYLYIILAAAMWGFIGPLGKMAFQEGVSPLEVAFWRAVLAWFCFAAQAGFQGRLRVDPGDLPRMAVFGFFCVTLFYGCYQIAVQQGGAALASVLLYTAPAWVVLLSRLVLKEPLTRPKLIALTLTITGVVLIAFNSGSGISLGGGIGFSAIAFGLMSGFCYSLYYIFGKIFSDRYSASVLFFYILPFGALCLFPFITFVHKSPAAWASLVMVAVMCTFGAYHSYYAGLRIIEAGRASILATTEPVMAALVAWIWWGEKFSLAGYAGSLLILAAVILMIRR